MYTNSNCLDVLLDSMFTINRSIDEPTALRVALALTFGLAIYFTYS